MELCPLLPYYLHRLPEVATRASSRFKSLVFKRPRWAFPPPVLSEVLSKFLAGVILVGSGTLAGAALIPDTSTAAPPARPELCGFGQEHPFWAAVTYMGQDNEALRLLAARTDNVDAHLRGTPAQYAAATESYDVLLGYIAREVYLCNVEPLANG